MVNTFTLVRDNLDSDQFRIVTRRKTDPIVWGDICHDFFTDAGTGNLLERAKPGSEDEIECVILTKERYDKLVAGYDFEEDE